jgi:uncharacterized iron-regulated protein
MRAIALSVVLTVAVAGQAAYVPERVFDTARRDFTDFEMMLADVAKADVVLVGEQHDDLNTHRLELALLEGLARRRDGVVVGLEMFERDVQEPLDHFQMGHLDEAEFLRDARPWPNYKTDYKPLVDFAVTQHWPVFASNVPRSVATEVSKAGFDALKAKSADEAKWFAKDRLCPVDDAYFKRFSAAMSEHPLDTGNNAKPPDAAAADRRSLERFYAAQCLKDETMSESIAQAYTIGAIGGKRPLVLHFNGAFHSDFAQGTAERARRRLPGRRIVLLSIVPVRNLETLAPAKDQRKRADYLVYTIGMKP